MNMKPFVLSCDKCGTEMRQLHILAHPEGLVFIGRCPSCEHVTEVHMPTLHVLAHIESMRGDDGEKVKAC